MVNLGEIDGLYNRSMQLLDIIIKYKKTFFVLDLSSSTIFYGEKDEEGEEVKSKTSVCENGIYEVFYSLYDYIRDKFLWSESGLVPYLSPRVRHGELESKLRPELTQRNLILQTNGDTYQPTPFWSLQYNLSPSENHVVNEALTKFSKGFDEEVVNLIKERLQIYDKEKKPDGLFDYETDTNELPSKAMEMGLSSRKKGKVEFCRLMIGWLWEKTESSLAKIRHYISGEFTNHINKLFDTLQYDLRPKVLPIGHAQKYLQSAITEASTVIASRIKNIEWWFNISGMKLEDVDLCQLTYQVFNNIESAYLQYPVDGRPEIEGESFRLKSVYVLHYKDLLTNLITNMLKHGAPDEDTALRPMVLRFRIGDDTLTLHFENRVTPGAEEYLNRQYGTDYISVMPTNLYGPNDNYHPEHSHVLPALIRRFHEAKESGAESVTCWGDGSPLREFLYVDDLANRCVFLMNNYSGNETVNAGTGKELTIKQLTELVAKIVGYKGRIEWDTTRPNGTPRKLLDVSKAAKLGWTYKTELEDGIRLSYEDFLNNPMRAER